jgi:hypothetical protein
MAARIDHGRAQLLTATGLDWSDKYPSIVAALANVKAKTAYLDGELCGVDDAGLRALPILDNDCWACVRAPATRACSLKGEWLKPRVMNLRDSLWFEEAAQWIVGEMSCSPIILPDGGAVSVEGRREGGPNPMLAANLPAWLLEEAATSS